ncbi:NADPH:quinone oxidoreductase family protein [Thermomonas carbonis]|uniref:NADPH:quinone oxidoreductase family protein n=1 Tax=Thermomonas carbonis TaxID=1463158 RepID=A0A7G9SML0_9GAMM|nr:NADPH:quinone oxidoreductase family protein [Thermomonas carbonis]QNN69085.1 NADPH:quinone oxidoreductase family protein [Thermomonas carbonis]GHC06870.1 oxidoreductase [Thermomonas carbonis]
MKAVVCEAWGTPDTLQVKDLPLPEPGPGQVRVRVRAAAVNFPDALLVAGKYQFKPDFPFSPGAEFSGTVSALGSDVSFLAIGDKVVGTAAFGAYAEEVLADAGQVVALPADTADDELELAGSFLLTYGTSYHALKDRAEAQPGETLLVLGAGGGVGLAAVELGKQMGLRVIAAASTEAKRDAARSRGADEVIDYTRDDFREQLKILTGGRGVDIAYDPVGGDIAETALRSVGWGGRYLVVGFAAGGIPKLPSNLLLLKGSALVGVFWGEFVRREPEANAANTRQLLGWLHDGVLRPLISARYPLSGAAEALDALLGRDAIGKLVIVPSLAR